MAVGDTKLVSVKISDILPLVLHNHKGSCRILERLGGLLFARLKDIDQTLSAAEFRDHMKTDNESFATFRNNLCAAWALKYHTVCIVSAFTWHTLTLTNQLDWLKGKIGYQFF